MGRPRKRSYTNIGQDREIPIKTKIEIVTELSQDKKRELLFKARSLLAVALWTVPPRKMIRALVAEIDMEIDRDKLVGRESESLPTDEA